jgi:aminoglycoside phosphotransferase (APT) family kinase protein
MTRQLPGLDLARLEEYVDRRVPGLRHGNLQAELITGGRSNLTYRITDGEWRWVLRRPPLGHVLETAHDMRREHRVLSALQNSPVPVPRPVLLCEDAEVIGAPFYVMDHVDGTPLRRAADLEVRGAPRTTAICEAMVDTLADLHSISPTEIGLEDFGRPQGFVGRQVHRWKRQLDQSRSRPLKNADELYDELAAVVPTDSRAAIVHGDYRLDNLLVDNADRVTAVLDWEMATLGDPLTDVALLMVYQTLATWPGAEAISDAPRAPGYLGAPQILERYAGASEVDTSRMSFYYALGCFKLAAILEGIYYRDVQGQSVEQGMGDVGEYVEPLLKAGREALTD